MKLTQKFTLTKRATDRLFFAFVAALGLIFAIGVLTREADGQWTQPYSPATAINGYTSLSLSTSGTTTLQALGPETWCAVTLGTGSGAAYTAVIELSDTGSVPSGSGTGTFGPQAGDEFDLPVAYGTGTNAVLVIDDGTNGTVLETRRSPCSSIA
jgi:hypothetical protein